MEVEYLPQPYGNGGGVWHRKGDEFYWHKEDMPARKHGDGTETWWYYNTEYRYPDEMPLNLFISYCKWEYRKNGKRM